MTQASFVIARLKEETAYCYCCGKETAISDLDGKPDWTVLAWLVKVIFGLNKALSFAADHGHDFYRLECSLCYGSDYATLQESSINALKLY